MKIDNLQNQILKEVIQSEYNRIKLFITALIIGFLLMSFLLFGLPNVSDFFNYSITPKLVILWILAFILYEVIMLLQLGEKPAGQKGFQFPFFVSIIR